MKKPQPPPIDFGDFSLWLLGQRIAASQIPTVHVNPCPFCGTTADALMVTGSHPSLRPEYRIACETNNHQCGCTLVDSNLQTLFERWNRRAVVGDDQKILKAATANRIWLNAMTHRVPSNDTLIALGQTVLDMLRQPENLVTLDQDNPCEAMRKIGQLQPVLFLRINQS